MTQEQKKQVKDALMRYTGNFASQTEAAESLHGISSATISQVQSHNWDLLSDGLWQHIAKQVGFYSGAWQPADTSTTLLLSILFSDAQRYAMAYGISIGQGLGKTFAANQYAKANENIFYIAGSREYNRKSFLRTLMGAAGEKASGSAPEMMEQIATMIGGMNQPLLIIDDAHLLKDRVLHLVVLLANSLAEKVGIVLMGNDELRMRIVEGMRLKKLGFNEIYKTIGRRFITLNFLAPGDIPAVCNANGIHDADMVSYIKDTSGNDLHAATCLINQQKEQRIAA